MNQNKERARICTGNFAFLFRLVNPTRSLSGYPKRYATRPVAQSEGGSCKIDHDHAWSPKLVGRTYHNDDIIDLRITNWKAFPGPWHRDNTPTTVDTQSNFYRIHVDNTADDIDNDYIIIIDKQNRTLAPLLVDPTGHRQKPFPSITGTRRKVFSMESHNKALHRSTLVSRLFNATRFG